jgi:hypothetical protein
MKSGKSIKVLIIVHSMTKPSPSQYSHVYSFVYLLSLGLSSGYLFNVIFFKSKNKGVYSHPHITIHTTVI